MKKTLCLISIVALSCSLLTACGGGGSEAAQVSGSGGVVADGGTGITYQGISYTHAQTAEMYITALQAEDNDGDGFKVALVKVDTQQAGYIVISDTYYAADGDTAFVAVNVDQWNPSIIPGSIEPFSNPKYSFENLQLQADGTYKDPVTGTVF